MQPVLQTQDVKTCEQSLTLEGVSLAELMRRAGHSVAQEVVNDFEPASKVIVFCGIGNNGGDGWVAAEQLLNSGYEVLVITPTEPSEISSPLAQMVAKASITSGLHYETAPQQSQIMELISDADVIIDAIFGTGFHGNVEAPYDIWIECINASSALVISVDVPSGLSAETGDAICAVNADTTVTMIALKPGLISRQGRDYVGSLVVAPLAHQTDAIVEETGPLANCLSTADYIDVVSPQSKCVDKFSRGRVLVVGGSKRFCGAPIMAALAAARAGAGYVTLAVPSCIATVVRTHVLEIPVYALPSNDEGTFSAAGRDQLTKLAQKANTVLAGPGMGLSADTVSIITALLGVQRDLVLDADALNALSRMTNGRLDNYPEIVRRERALVLTPHRVELARLTGLADTPPYALVDAIEAARRLVWSNGAQNFCVVAKGEATACVDVEQALIPKAGPASLATAGTGDVLGGVIAALMSFRASDATTTGGAPGAESAAGANDASLSLLCALASFIHGEAAQLAEERYGSQAVMAKDVIDCLGLAQDDTRAAIIDAYNASIVEAAE